MPERPPSFAPAQRRPRPDVAADLDAAPADPTPASIAEEVAAEPASSTPQAPEPASSPAQAPAPRAEPRIRSARLDRTTPPVQRPVPDQTTAPVSSGLQDRLAERQSALRHRRIRMLVITGAMVVVLACAGWVLAASPWLALTESQITVTGAGEGVATEEIVDRVAPQIGTPLARLDTGDMAAEVESIIGVKEASVSRAWPTGVEVDVVARTPIAAVTSQEGYLIVDADGVELNEVDELDELDDIAGIDGDAGELPVVDVPTDDGDVGETVSAVLAVMGDLPSQLEVSEAGATSAERIELTLADGQTVEWGDAHDNELKSEVLLTLLSVSADTYNVAEPLSPTTS